MRGSRHLVGLAAVSLALAFADTQAAAEGNVIGMLEGWRTVRAQIDDKAQDDQKEKASLLQKQGRLGASQEMLSENLKHLNQQLDEANSDLATLNMFKQRHDSNPPDLHCVPCVDRYNAEARDGDAKFETVRTRIADLTDEIGSAEALRQQTNDKVIANAQRIQRLTDAVSRLTATAKWVSQTYNACLELTIGGASPEKLKYECGNITFDGEQVHLSSPKFRPRNDCFFEGPNCRARNP